MNKKIVFWGIGEIGKAALIYASRLNIKVDIIVDSNEFLWGKEINNVLVQSAGILINNNDRYIVVVNVGKTIMPEIENKLTMWGYIEHYNFFKGYDVFPIELQYFGKESGVFENIYNYKFVKTVAPNKLLIDTENKCVFRLIAPNLESDFKRIYKLCYQNNIFGKYLINTKVSNKKIDDEYNLVFEHEYIPFFTSAVEFSPKMFLEYTIFMIDFLEKLDKSGLGWGDVHAFNATLHNGRFVFFDFDALCIGHTAFHNIVMFINTHIVILLMISHNMLSKAKIYLQNNSEIPTIKDIQGYLTSEEFLLFINMFDECQRLSINGEIVKCCDVLRQYVNNLSFDKAFVNIWDNYQKELFENNLSLKQKKVLDTIFKLTPDTVLDIAGNMGWYEFQIASKCERAIVADLDENCIDFVFDKVYTEGIKNVIPVHMNLVTPTLGEYKGIAIGGGAVKWASSGFERLKSDLVLALAIIHHLAFSQQLSFEECIGQLSLFTKKWLLIEFVDRSDIIVKPVLTRRFDWYTRQNFENALMVKFKILSCSISEETGTRYLYLAEKNN